MIQIVTAPWGFTVIQWDSDNCDSGCFLSDHYHLLEAWKAAHDFAAHYALPLEDFGNIAVLTDRRVA